MKRAAVVGAGFAGLSAALTLARAGCAVTVFEARDRAGGRAGAFTSPQGCRFDEGPTLLIMADTLRRALGPAFEDLALRRLEPNYRVEWSSGDYFESHSDAARIVEEFRRFEPHGAPRGLQYLADVHEQFTIARTAILDVDLDWKATARLLTRPRGLQPWAMRNLRRFTAGYFKHPRLIEALTFQPLYLGMSPLRSPAIYALLAVEEMVGGVWFAPGGTASVVAAMQREAERLGVQFAFDAPVASVQSTGGRAHSIETANGTHALESLVIASDREPAMRDLFAAPPRIGPRYGHSAAVFYLGLNRRIESAHHTVLLPDAPWSAYAELDAGRVPSDPMVYACNPVVSDPAMAPADMTALMLLVPVPNTALANIDVAEVRARAIARAERSFGAIAPHIVFSQTRAPQQFATDLGLMHGAAFGPDHALTQMGPLRPGIAHPTLRNVAFAGSGTRPGSGVPMVIMSGRLAAEHVLAS